MHWPDHHLSAFKRLVFPILLLLVWCAACAVPFKSAEKEPAPAPAPESEQAPMVPNNSVEATLPKIRYAIQVGAFSTAERAAAYAAALQQDGVETYYFVDADGLFKVRIERFDTRAAALERAAALKTGGLIDHYFIVAPLPAEDGQAAAGRDGLLQTALRFIGTPYRWGGASAAEGFDCSGLTRTVYRLNGLELPRSAVEQYRQGVVVPRHQIEIGDLLFFDINRSGRVSHVGIYCGGNRFIHAPGRGKPVRTASLSHAYFENRYLGARRYF